MFQWGLSCRFILSFYKDYILVHRAILKSLTYDYLSRLLDFGPQGNTQISQIGHSNGRNSNQTFSCWRLQLDLQPVVFEILPKWTFYHDLCIKYFWFSFWCFINVSFIKVLFQSAFQRAKWHSFYWNLPPPPPPRPPVITKTQGAANPNLCSVFFFFVIVFVGS